MKNIKRSIVFFVTFFSASTCLFAAFNSDSKGIAGAQFLKLGAGARGSGMGEGFSAVVDDATAIYWNPAAILNSKPSSLTLMHAALFEDINYQFLGYSKRLQDDSAFGIGLTRLSAGAIKHTDSSGIETGDSSSPSDIAVSLGYAKTAGNWNIGAAAKYIRSAIVKSASAFAIDAGILSPALMDDKFHLSIVAQNLGTKLKFDKKSDPLPLNVKVGASLAITNKLLIAADINLPYDNGVYLGGGAEYWFSKGSDWNFAGRAGVNTRAMGDISGLNGFSLGLGAVFSQVDLDYAFIPFGDLGSTHRVSVGIGFGSAEKKSSYIEPKKAIAKPAAEVKPKTIQPVYNSDAALLITKLSDESWQVRQKAAESLGSMHAKQGVTPLIEALNDENDKVTSSAASSLGQLGDKTAVQPLIDSLNDSSALVRTAAAKSLGALGDRRAVGPLKKILRDDDPSVRKAVSAALSALAN